MFIFCRLRKIREENMLLTGQNRHCYKIQKARGGREDREDREAPEVREAIFFQGKITFDAGQVYC